MIYRDHTASRCRFLCAGPDALRYLNGQVSQDIRRVSKDHSLPACITNAKGRLESVVRISAASTATDSAPAFWIDGPADQRDFLALRLEKYLIADDCTLADIGDATAQIFTNCSTPPTGPWCASVADGVSGFEIILPRADAPALFATLEEIGARAPDPVAWEDERIRRGSPVWNRELDADTLPPEAGLDATHIDYHKGCYIGQEVISRLKSVGQVTRRLCRVESPSTPLATGWELFPADAAPTAARAIGHLTSVTSDGRHALAYLRRPHHQPGTTILALPNDGSGASIPVVVLSSSAPPPAP